MRIAIISLMNGVPWGGSEELWAGMARRALEQGHKIGVSVETWPQLPAALEGLMKAGAFISRRPRRNQRSFLKKAWRHFFQSEYSAFAGIRSFGPDVVCVNQAGSHCAQGYPGLDQLLAEWGCPYVILSNSSDDRAELNEDTRETMLRIFAGAFRAGFPSLATQQRIETQLTWRLPNAFLFQYPLNIRDLSELPWPSEEIPSFAFVGRVCTMKGIDCLFEALATETWRNRQFRLRLYGDVANPSYFRRLAAFYEISRSVEFCGHASDIRDVWARNHVFVLPSRQEGAPISLLEAMVCARPSVVTAVGGIADCVREGETGFIAEAPTPELLSRALERAWQSRDAWKEMGRRARSITLERIEPDPGGSCLQLLLEAAQGAKTRIESPATREIS